MEHERKTLREWRELRNMTQFELSVKSGVSVSSISTAELGKHTLSIKNAVKVANALDVRLDDVEWEK